MVGGGKMSKGLWPAISGSIAQSERLDTAANNLANVETNGFKKDQVAFRSVVSSAVAAAMKEDIPRKLYTEKDFHRLDGADTTYTVVDGTYTDHSPGRIKVTNSPLDVAIEGKGFLEVLTPQGARFTRQGSLRMNNEGGLVTMDGAGAKPATREELKGRAILLDPAKNGKLTITSSGQIFQGNEQVAELSIVEFVDSKLLTKEGSAVFRNETPSNIMPELTGTSVRQGMLETSNVNSVAEMMEVLKASRLFEANEKIVKSYGDLESRAVNDLGKL